MKRTLTNSATAAILALSLLSAAPLMVLAQVSDDPVMECHVLTHVSSALTQTAGYTETTQAGPLTALLPASYSNGVLGAATPTETVIPPWVDPATDGNFTGSGALWVSTHTSWPGGSGNTEGTAPSDQWRLFHDSFSLPANAVISSATLSYAADNATDVYLNGSTTPTSSTSDTYGVAPVAGPQNYATVVTTPIAVTPGATTLDFVVRNWAVADVTTNPTGLLYKTEVHYCVPVPSDPPATVTVSITKLIDGVQALASTTGSASFPMSATWNTTNIGSGTGTYTLDTSNGYQTATAAMNSGSDYATNEILSGSSVSTTCDGVHPFALVGYTSGTSTSAALAGTPTTTAPSFTNLMENKYVMVWNHDCTNLSGSIGGTVTGGVSGTGALVVTGITPLQTTSIADNTYANGLSYTFNITIPTNETNLKMKFADWFNPAVPSTIPAGNNMQISSLQADNGNAPVPITAANLYSTPALHMTTDLDLTTPGIQVQVLVQMKIPVGSINGSYSTSYGVQTLP